MVILLSNIVIAFLGLLLIIKNGPAARLVQKKLNSGFSNTYGRLIDLNSNKTLVVLRFVLYVQGFFIFWGILWTMYIDNECIYLKACFL
jgi:hypothetical protein